MFALARRPDAMPEVDSGDRAAVRQREMTAKRPTGGARVALRLARSEKAPALHAAPLAGPFGRVIQAVFAHNRTPDLIRPAP